MEFESYSELLRRFPKMRLRGWDESVLTHFVQFGEIEAETAALPTCYNVADVRSCLAYYCGKVGLAKFNGEGEA